MSAPFDDIERTAVRAAIWQLSRRALSWALLLIVLGVAPIPAPSLIREGR
jgi:hypothetical protein